MSKLTFYVLFWGFMKLDFRSPQLCKCCAHFLLKAYRQQLLKKAKIFFWIRANSCLIICFLSYLRFVSLYWFILVFALWSSSHLCMNVSCYFLSTQKITLWRIQERRTQGGHFLKIKETGNLKWCYEQRRKWTKPMTWSIAFSASGGVQLMV